MNEWFSVLLAGPDHQWPSFFVEDVSVEDDTELVICQVAYPGGIVRNRYRISDSTSIDTAYSTLIITCFARSKKRTHSIMDRAETYTL